SRVTSGGRRPRPRRPSRRRSRSRSTGPRTSFRPSAAGRAASCTPTSSTNGRSSTGIPTSGRKTGRSAERNRLSRGVHTALQYSDAVRVGMAFASEGANGSDRLRHPPPDDGVPHLRRLSVLLLVPAPSGRRLPPVHRNAGRTDPVPSPLGVDLQLSLLPGDYLSELDRHVAATLQPPGDELLRPPGGTDGLLRFLSRGDAEPLADAQRRPDAVREVPPLRPEVRRAQQLLPEHARQRGDAHGDARARAAGAGRLSLPGPDRAQLHLHEAALPAR